MGDLYEQALEEYRQGALADYFSDKVGERVKAFVETGKTFNLKDLQPKYADESPEVTALDVKKPSERLKLPMFDLFDPVVQKVDEKIKAHKQRQAQGDVAVPVKQFEKARQVAHMVKAAPRSLLQGLIRQTASAMEVPVHAMLFDTN